MDDFVISNLNEARNEWCSRLISILTPLVSEGVRSIFNEAWNLCLENNEANKYLMTFQNLISRVPKWNSVIIEEERKRIIERSGCNYLEDLITCVHIIQLKVLTCIRVGNKQKKIDISIPKLDSFIHKVYINTARTVYKNVFLFEKNISPLQVQKNNRELETIIQESILIAIRESIPTEAIIRAYMDETVEQEEEVIIEKYEEPVRQEENDEFQVEDPIKNEEELPAIIPAIQNIDDKEVVTKLTFNNMDSVMDEQNSVRSIEAPKSIERLEEISTARAIQRRLEEEEDEDEERIKIHSDSIDLSGLGLVDLNAGDGVRTDDFVLDDFEEL
jgi:Family of unknown function (DUF5764)